MQYFPNENSKPRVKLSLIWKKTQSREEILKIFDENAKNEFLSILGKFVAKNGAFGNNILLQQFFPGRSAV